MQKELPFMNEGQGEDSDALHAMELVRCELANHPHFENLGIPVPLQRVLLLWVVELTRADMCHLSQLPDENVKAYFNRFLMKVLSTVQLNELRV